MLLLSHIVVTWCGLRVTVDLGLASGSHYLLEINPVEWFLEVIAGRPRTWRIPVGAVGVATDIRPGPTRTAACP